MNEETQQLAEEIINALGSQHFNPDDVITALREAELKMQKAGQNTGSILAVMNILPSITEQAKRLY